MGPTCLFGRLTSSFWTLCIMCFWADNLSGTQTVLDFCLPIRTGVDGSPMLVGPHVDELAAQIRKFGSRFPTNCCWPPVLVYEPKIQAWGEQPAGRRLVGWAAVPDFGFEPWSTCAQHRGSVLFPARSGSMSARFASKITFWAKARLLLANLFGGNMGNPVPTRCFLGCFFAARTPREPEWFLLRMCETKWMINSLPEFMNFKLFGKTILVANQKFGLFSWPSTQPVRTFTMFAEPRL